MSFSQQIRHDKSFHLAPKSKNCQFATFQCYAERSRNTHMIYHVFLNIIFLFMVSYTSAGNTNYPSLFCCLLGWFLSTHEKILCGRGQWHRQLKTTFLPHFLLGLLSRPLFVTLTYYILEKYPGISRDFPWFPMFPVISHSFPCFLWFPMFSQDFSCYPELCLREPPT